MFPEITAVTDEEVFEELGKYVTGERSLVEMAIAVSAEPEMVRGILERHGLEVREPSKDDLAERAAACLQPKKDGDGYQYSHEDKTELEDAVTAILERANIDHEQFGLSESGLRREVMDLLWEAKQNPGQTATGFWNRMDEIHRVLGTRDRTTYSIVFPLNLVFKGVERSDEFQVLGETVEAITDEDWTTCCEWAYDEEEERAAQSNAVNKQNRLERQFEGSPNQLDRGGQSYWMVEVEALDRRFALGTCISTLQFLLGRINYALTRNRLEGEQFNSSVWNTRWMDLRLPFVYLVFADNEYSSFFHSRDPTPRRSVVLHGHKATRYKSNLEEIPRLRADLNEMESRLVKAVSSFQDGVTNTDREDMFLHFWRGAEWLTLTSETDTTSTVVQRARTVARTSNVASQSVVRYKRNKLVHEGESVEITTDDTNTVKDMLEELIALYVERAGDWSHDQFLFFFENADKSDDALDHLQQVRETDIEMIEKIQRM